jgi:hypothetical protein
LTAEEVDMAKKSKSNVTRLLVAKVESTSEVFVTSEAAKAVFDGSARVAGGMGSLVAKVLGHDHSPEMVIVTGIHCVADQLEILACACDGEEIEHVKPHVIEYTLRSLADRLRAITELHLAIDNEADARYAALAAEKKAASE